MIQRHVDKTALNVIQFRAATKDLDEPVERLNGQQSRQETLGEAQGGGGHCRRRVVNQLVVDQTILEQLVEHIANTSKFGQ